MKITLVTIEKDMRLWHLPKDNKYTICEQEYGDYKAYPEKLTEDMKYICPQCKEWYGIESIAPSQEGMK